MATIRPSRLLATGQLMLAVTTMMAAFADESLGQFAFGLLLDELAATPAPAAAAG